MTRISVVIPAYEGSAFIREALDSVFGQTCAAHEVIVVDDASGDNTAELVEAIARTAPVPVRLIRLAKNSGGPAHPINVGIDAAQGEVIAVLDQDDVYRPTKLETEAVLLARHPELSFAFSLCRVLETGKLQQWPQVINLLHAAGKERDGYYLLEGQQILQLLVRHENFLGGYPGFVFRKRDWQRKGGVDEGLGIASDFDLLCWLATCGSAAFVPRIGYFRREHGANLTNREAIRFWEAICIKARYLVRERGLRRDPEVAREFGDLFLRLAEVYVRAGEHGRALACCRLSGRVWGWGPRTLRTALRVVLARARRAWDRTWPREQPVIPYDFYPAVWNSYYDVGLRRDLLNEVGLAELASDLLVEGEPASA